MLRAIKRRQEYIPIDPQNSSVGRSVVSASIWSGLDAGFNALISFVRSIILARLLSPSDFGIISIATVFTQFILIFTNFGFTASIIYHRNITSEDICTSWWGNLTIDLSATLVCIGLALFSKRFVATPETPWVIVILASQFFISSVGAINMALLQRLFKFKITTLIKISGAIVSLVVTLILVMAFKMNVYGLAWGMVAGTIWTTLMYFIFLPWLPSFRISFESAKKHLSYGGWLLGVNVITYANGNLDKMIIGGTLDNSQLGYFEYASRFPSMVIYELGQVLNRVLFSAFSTLQDDLEKMNLLLANLFRYNSLVVYPMLFGLAAVARDFTIVLYGKKWEPIILPMQILCIYGAIRIFTNPLYALANGIGKPSMPFKWAAIALPMNAIIVYILILYQGVVGVAIGKGFLSIFLLFTLGIELAANMKRSFLKMLLEAWPALLCGSIMLLVVRLVRVFLLNPMESDVFTLLVQIGVGVLAYIAAVRILFPRDIALLYRVLRKKQNRLQPEMI